MTPLRTLRLAVFGACLSWLLLLAIPAHPAVWIKLHFTAPGDVAGEPGEPVSGVGRYRVEAWDGVRWDSLRIYRLPGVAGVPVLPAGTPCSLYVSQTVAPHTSRAYRMLSIDNSGNRAKSSNYAVVATGFPDTIVGLIRPARRRGFGFQRTFGAPVVWSLIPGDTAEVRAAHQEEIQRACRGRICELFGRWALRGGWEACP